MSEEAKSGPSRDGAAVRLPPPFVPLIGLAVGALFEWTYGPLATPLLGMGRYLVGGVLVLVAAGLILAAGRLFQRSSQRRPSG